MPDDLESAVHAFQQAQAALPDAQAAARQLVANARADVERTRTALARAIVHAAKGGMRQRDIVAATGYSRESIRRICRAAGFEPAD